MKPIIPAPPCEDVLNAFAVEPNHDHHTLEWYLKEYPQYGVELAVLSHELSRAVEKPAPLSAEDRAAIDAAWLKHAGALSVSPVDLFASFSVPQLRDLAEYLGVPRQIITAFREHKVIVSSIPMQFLARLASAMKKNVEEVSAALAFSQDAGSVRSHKADEKPKSVAPATFEKLLIDAGVPADKRAKLMAGES
jgi:hypothetical protein